jgi:general secretion pathway protein D
MRIGADKVANAVVVFASAPDFAAVRDLVAKLDVPRRQVYVEATVLDLSVDHERALGISFHDGSALGSGAVGLVGSGSSALNSLNLSAQTVASALGAGGLLAGVVGPSFQVFGQDVPSFGVLLQALESEKDVDVLSRPHLLTMDNVKSSLSVGQAIPFPTGTLAAPSVGGTLAMQTSYVRQEVSLKLELTPHLNESDSIRLELDGEISDVADAQQTAGGPITNKRTVKTAIVVRDGDTVVLGGLQKEAESESVQKVPFFGDLPLIGTLFSHRSKTRVKQDLLIVLTPYIIRGPEDLRRIFERKEAERQEFCERFSAFKDRRADASNVDYRRKRGLLEEVNQSARAAEREATALRLAEHALRPPLADGPID